MAVEGADELAVYFDPDEFGTTATWTVAGTSHEVNGMFQDPHAEVGMLDDLGVSSTSPTFICPSSSVPAGGGQGDGLVIDGVSYRATDPRPSGNGLTRVVLEEV